MVVSPLSYVRADLAPLSSQYIDGSLNRAWVRLTSVLSIMPVYQ